MERLQKVLAKAGVASRRHSEELIISGRVKVNEKVVTQLGIKVDWQRDVIQVDNRKIIYPEDKVYLILNKPVGYVTTLKDPQGRKNVADLVRDVKQRVYPVGRLDSDTEGLLLMTNDGELAQVMTHPRYGIEKTYLAKVSGIPHASKLKAFEKGIRLEDGMTAPVQAHLVTRLNNNALIEIKIREGRKRQVRRMCKAIGHPVLELKRIQIDFLKLGNLKLGSYRFLTPAEINKLKKLIIQKKREAKKLSKV